jgi:hypothetical protein
METHYILRKELETALMTVNVVSEDESQFAIYPNPSSTKCTLQFGSIQSQANILVLNSLGQHVESRLKHGQV